MLSNKNKLPNKFYFHFSECISKDYIIFVFADDLWGQVWRRQWHPSPVLLPGKSHGRRGLVGFGPWGYEESDMTERLCFSLSCIGEGNGNPLQCSCLENPRDSRAWWAAVYGVGQSRTRLKWLNSLAVWCQELPSWLGGKESAWQSRSYRRCGFYPWVGESPGVGNGSPL